MQFAKCAEFQQYVLKISRYTARLITIIFIGFVIYQ